MTEAAMKELLDHQEQLGFSVLPKNTLTDGWGGPRIELPTSGLQDDLSRPEPRPPHMAIL